MRAAAFIHRRELYELRLLQKKRIAV